jgi:myo-inositol-1(or 4)-monophosphatase
MRTTTTELTDQALKSATAAVLKAGVYLLDQFGKTHTINLADRHEKIADDLKTEEIILDALSKTYTDEFSYHSEESSSDNSAEVLFVIDPIEGTGNFARGIPFFATQIAIIIQDVLCASVVYEPIQNKLFSAKLRRGAFLNENRLTALPISEPRTSILAGSAGRNIQAKTALAECFATLAPTIRSSRMYGACSLELAYVAQGKINCYINCGSNLYDIAPGALLVQEAGGTISDLQGKPFSIQSRSLLATHGVEHEQILKLLSHNID